MADNKTTYHSFEEAFRKLYSDLSFEKEHYSIRETKLSEDFIGCRAIVGNANDNCFMTKFKPEDIQYFESKLKDPAFKNPLMDESNERRLHGILDEWVRKNKPLSPVEPFLYALKLVDGVVGSISNNAAPRPKQLNAFASALGAFWDGNSPRDMQIARHILVNWDWYQPLMVLIKMYELSDTADDEQIDEILREQKLKNPDYSGVTFQCLSYHVNEENAMALLTFASRSEQKAAITGSPISVTRSMYNAFSAMYDSAPEEVRSFLKEKYETVVRGDCDKRSRRFLDNAFQIGAAFQTPVRDHFLAYYTTTSKDDKTAHYEYILQNWDLGDIDQQRLCSQVQDEALLSLLNRRLSNPDITPFSYASALYNLAQNPYEGAQKTLKEKIDSMQPQDRTWLAWACASNKACDSPSLEEIAEQFFLHGNGYRYRIQLQWLTRQPQKAQVFRSAVQQIVERIKDTPDKYRVFLRGCQEIYQKEYGETNYPIQADKILERAIQFSADHDRTLIDVVLDVIKNVSRRTNRSRYEAMLIQIYYNKQFGSAVRKRARELLDKIYLG